MYFVIFGVALFLVILGAIIRSGKASWMIAGYNTMSKDEKAKYDEKAMCKFISNLLFMLAAMQLLLGAAIYIKSATIVVLSTILFLVIIFGAVIYMNTGNRFKV